MKPKPATTLSYCDLVLANGDIVRISYPDEFCDEFFDSIENSMKRREWWSPKQWDACDATLNGLHVQRVNMGQVVAML